MYSIVPFTKYCIFICIASFDLPITLWGKLDRDYDICFDRCEESGSESLSNFIMVTHLLGVKPPLELIFRFQAFPTLHQNMLALLGDGTAWSESAECWLLGFG